MSYGVFDDGLLPQTPSKRLSDLGSISDGGAVESLGEAQKLIERDMLLTTLPPIVETVPEKQRKITAFQVSGVSFFPVHLVISKNISCS